MYFIFKLYLQDGRMKRYVYMYAFMQMYLNIYIYLYIYVYAFIYTLIDISINTYTVLSGLVRY